MQDAGGLRRADRRGAGPRQRRRDCSRSQPRRWSLTGDDDRVIPAASSELLRERIPGARLEVIPGAGHLFFIEKPDETLALLEDFLA